MSFLSFFAGEREEGSTEVTSDPQPLGGRAEHARKACIGADESQRELSGGKESRGETW